MRLETLEQNHQQWLIDQFVAVANQFLPQFLPETKGNTKVKEEINARLVRHYTSMKLLDEPCRTGKYAVYTYRHLLQLLLVRRLLNQGITAIAINDLLTSKTNQELKSLLIGGIQIDVTIAHPSLTNTNTNTQTNPALEYLQSLKKTKSNKLSKLDNLRFNQEQNLSLNSTDTKPKNQAHFNLNQPQEWTRIEVLDGLELNIRADFIYPNSISEQESLKQLIIQTLTQILTRKKP